jgi:hypothetical protein
MPNSRVIGHTMGPQSKASNVEISGQQGVRHNPGYTTYRNRPFRKIRVSGSKYSPSSDGGKQLAGFCGVAPKSSTSPSTLRMDAQNNTEVLLVPHRTPASMETFFKCLAWQKFAYYCALASEMLAMSRLLLYCEGFRIRRELHVKDTTQLYNLADLV